MDLIAEKKTEIISIRARLNQIHWKGELNSDTVCLHRGK